MMLIAIIGVILFPCMVSAQVEAGQIAFTGTIRETLTYTGDKVVKFPGIITNHGGAFSKATGIFTIPRNGLYVFSVSAVSQKGKELLVDLYQNDQYVWSAYGNHISGESYGANTAVLRLVKGDQVKVKTRRELNLYSAPEDVYVSFGGFILGLLSIPEKF